MFWALTTSSDNIIRPIDSTPSKPSCSEGVPCSCLFGHFCLTGVPTSVNSTLTTG